MASFQAKICWKRPRKRENKICHSVPFLPETIMASFQSKTGWKRLKKRENKNYRFFSFLPDA